MSIVVQTYTDGDNITPLDILIKESWIREWKRYYEVDLGCMSFSNPINLKISNNTENLGKDIKFIIDIRNPDLLYCLDNTNEIISGVEITDHSPDGSNADKRYPFLWASKQVNAHGFIICPYCKGRPVKEGKETSQINRLPFRHASRNLKFMKAWQDRSAGSLLQILPIKELQGSSTGIDPIVAKQIPSVNLLGQLLAHLTASKLGNSTIRASALNIVDAISEIFENLARACMAATTRVEPSSVYKDLENDRWICLYNSRPDSGHWERGEGQFDSIDGRMMFLLDEIFFLPEEDRPSIIELWLPQMASNHPWIKEQFDNEYGSKRFRNLIQVLSSKIKIKFADNLSNQDWEILEKNQSLTLERADWDPGIFLLSQYFAPGEESVVARYGEHSISKGLASEVIKLLKVPNLYYSSHRAYTPGWHADFEKSINKIGISNSIILVPRIPKSKLGDYPSFQGKIIPAEDCDKSVMVALRQIYKYIRGGKK